ncbi:MAG: hypothetical protein V4615_01505 [Bacteroidota bacterium]
MPYQNISATLSNADWNTIKQKFTEIEALMPFLVNLTAQERRMGLKLGKKTEKFLYDVQKVATLSPQYVPVYIDIAEFGKDFDLFLNLSFIELKLRELTEAVNDTRKAVGMECTNPALAIYQNIKNASLSNVPGADSALNDLKPYFKKARRKKP